MSDGKKKLKLMTKNAKAQRILEDKELFLIELRKYPSLAAMAVGLKIDQASIGKARRFHGIPKRPYYTVRDMDLSGMTADQVLADPIATETLMNRAYIRAGVCPYYCRFYNGESCPKTAGADDYWEDDGRMHPDCPIPFYVSTKRDGNSRIQIAFRQASRNIAKREREERRRQEMVEMEREREPLGEKPDDPLEFMRWITTEDANAHYKSAAETRQMEIHSRDR